MVGGMREGWNSGVFEVSGNSLWLALHLLVTAVILAECPQPGKWMG